MLEQMRFSKDGNIVKRACISFIKIDYESIVINDYSIVKCIDLFTSCIESLGVTSSQIFGTFDLDKGAVCKPYATKKERFLLGQYLPTFFVRPSDLILHIFANQRADKVSIIAR